MLGSMTKRESGMRRDVCIVKRLLVRRGQVLAVAHSVSLMLIFVRKRSLLVVAGLGFWGVSFVKPEGPLGIESSYD